ncbi:hypothetical protein A2V82_05215 [candidate division KSB1 bacterium RBG_16_48_16]|nr:MAG: hypothetical protein A2V82_05215 [candidate division KSB1 bacterium RBG_16_48_16]
MKFNIRNILFLCFGAFSSINQGFTMVLGMWDGSPYGAEVIILSDLPMYLLFFLVPSKRAKKHALFISMIKVLTLVFFLWAQTSWLIAEKAVVLGFGMVHLTRAMIVFYFLATRLVKVEYVQNLVNGLVFGLCFQALIGVWQWQIGPVVLPFFNIVNTGWRSTGTMVDPNVFGVYLLTMLPFVWRTFVFWKLKPKMVYLGITIVGGASLFASYSRGAWLSFLVATLVFLLVDYNKGRLKRRHLTIFAIAATVIFVLMSTKYKNVISNRMSNIGDAIAGQRSSSSRMFLARDAMRIINEHKIMGVGLNQYRFYATETTQGLKMVHNAYLLVAAEQGILGALLLVIIFAWSFTYGSKLLRSKNIYIYDTASAALNGILAFMIYNMGAPDYHVPEITWHSWKLVGMVCGMLVCAEQISIHKTAEREKMAVPEEKRPADTSKISQANFNVR